MVHKEKSNSQDKLKFYASLKECPDFEQYLKLSSPKLRQAITKIRISAHKFPIETGWYEKKIQQIHFAPCPVEILVMSATTLSPVKTKRMSSVRSKFITPFFHNWKGTNKISNEELCRAILSCQNDDITSQVGLFCLKRQKAFEEQAPWNYHY